MKYYFANWKMYQSLESIQLFMKNYNQDHSFQNLITDRCVGIAPSYEHLYMLKQGLTGSLVNIGSQDCSTFLKGAYTGQVGIESLLEIGLNFSIIGHSEARHYLQQSDSLIACKFTLLLAGGISPVLCIGETLQQKKDGLTLQVLYDQLEATLNFLQQYQGSTKIFIAYEPIYAIGSGIIPAIEDLRSIFYFLQSLVDQLPVAKNIMFLYGGSVSSDSVHTLQKINEISGFLIGKSSIDFQEFKKIVEL